MEKDILKLLPHPHAEILEELIFKLFGNINLDKPPYFLEGGTSLMLKYWHRVSYDIDLKTLESSKNIRRKISNLLVQVSEKYKKFIINRSKFEIELLNENNQVTKLKIDFRPSNCLIYEIITYKGLQIPKIVDELIVLNKLIRFNQRDKFDIDFLIKNRKIKKKDLLELLNECSIDYFNYKQLIMERINSLF